MSCRRFRIWGAEAVKILSHDDISVKLARRLLRTYFTRSRASSKIREHLSLNNVTKKLRNVVVVSKVPKLALALILTC